MLATPHRHTFFMIQQFRSSSLSEMVQCTMLHYAPKVYIENKKTDNRCSMQAAVNSARSCPAQESKIKLCKILYMICTDGSTTMHTATKSAQPFESEVHGTNSHDHPVTFMSRLFQVSVLPSTSTGASKSGWRLDTLHPKGFCEAWPFEVGPYPHCVQ